MEKNLNLSSQTNSDGYYQDSHFDFILSQADKERKASRSRYKAEKQRSNDFLARLQASARSETGVQKQSEKFQKEPLSSPLKGTYVSDKQKLSNLYDKLESCGVENYDFFNTKSENGKKAEITVPIFCDNRSCNNPECKKHRFYKYMKQHRHQILDINVDMKKPKAWIFTGYNLSFPIDRKFCQKQLNKLYNVLDISRHPKFGSLSKFSIHMELKLHGDHAYLHFHVTSSYIKNLKLIRAIWSRQIKYEFAIHPDKLENYISKYASKTPEFQSKSQLEFYHLAVYKLQMHRFKSDAIPLSIKSEWVNMTLLSLEVKRAYFRDSYLNPNISKSKGKSRNQYHPFLEPEKPPPNPLEVSKCVNMTSK